MYFEGDSLSQPQVSRSVISSQTKLREEPSRPMAGRADQLQSSRPDRLLPNAEWGSETDATYNRLQALMQLLYLLSRDPAVPNDARFHVTVAQSEIALLSRVMQKSSAASG
jgi:hypothetical protein